MAASLLLTVLAALAAAQAPIGMDNHPELTTYRCTKAGGCAACTNYIVLDSLSHNVHERGSPNSTCDVDTGGMANSTVCPTKEACATNCVMEAVTDYAAMGVTTSGDALRLLQVLPNGTVVSPRVYLLDSTKQSYEMLSLTGQEFSFDIETPRLPCGSNGALYLSEMRADGGRSALNTGGATWGTGYCDAQCYTTPFINGEANVDGAGACCGEMDIWEANTRSTQIAPHPCNQTGLYQCHGAECAREGVCDKSGCAWNPYRTGQTNYYGNNASFAVDSSRKMTVVTQFPVNTAGKLVQIRRLYVQDGVVIQSEPAQTPGVPAVSAIEDGYCNATGKARFMQLGALEASGDALSRGMVLALSLWWDATGFMNWLDSEDQGSGPCNATEGDPNVIRTVEPHPEVTFSNMRWGEIDSTYKAGY